MMALAVDDPMRPAEALVLVDDQALLRDLACSCGQQGRATGERDTLYASVRLPLALIRFQSRSGMPGRGGQPLLSHPLRKETAAAAAAAEFIVAEFAGRT